MRLMGLITRLGFSDGLELARTRDGPPDLGGGRLPHLQRGLLAVPGRVRRADQVGSVFQRALGKAATRTGGDRRDK